MSGEPDARAGASADPGASGGGVRELVLVRHAETAWSRSGRHTGATDVPLTDHGRQVASGLRERLSPYSFDVVLSSPLGRARETCELAGLADRVQLRAELAEWDYGDYEGLTTTQIHAQRPDWNMWRDGCPGGEDAADVGARVDRVIDELRDATVARSAVIFSHGHLLRVLGARWIGLEPADGRLLGLSTAAINVLGYEHGTAVIWHWNDDAGATLRAQ